MKIKVPRTQLYTSKKGITHIVEKDGYLKCIKATGKPYRWNYRHIRKCKRCFR